MKTTFIVALGLALLAPANAEARRPHWSHNHAVSTGGNEYYTARSGHQVHRPVQANSAPSGATARCGDGSWSFSESHRGTCSHHGGVASWR